MVSWTFPSRGTVLWAAVLINTELLLVLTYLAITGQGVTDPLFYAWPFIWLNVAIWGVRRVDRPKASDQASLIAGLVSAVYLIVLSYFGGLFALGGSETGVRFALDLPPGWGPAFLYSGSAVTIVLQPFKVIGYAVLAYLVGVTLLDATTSAWTGIFGLLSCFSCSWPLFATIIAWVFGSASGIGSVALGATYPLSTAAYLSAVVLLVWRPTIVNRGP